jgi:hypothetical protein
MPGGRAQPVVNRREDNMESTMQKPALVGANSVPRAITVAFWIATALFCLEMSFTA